MFDIIALVLIMNTLYVTNKAMFPPLVFVGRLVGLLEKFCTKHLMDFDKLGGMMETELKMKSFFVGQIQKKE